MSKYLDFAGLKAVLSGIKDYVEGSGLREVTHSELKELKNAGKLVAGRRYRITDYQCVVNEGMNIRSAGHQFDIVVTATGKNTLSEEARAMRHDNDHLLSDAFSVWYDAMEVKYGYFHYHDLSLWRLWYSLDSAGCDWPNNGDSDFKGTIYRMIDELGNDCPYDFKNIQFAKAAFNTDEKTLMGSRFTSDYYYTFNNSDKDATDSTVSNSGVEVCNNVVAALTEIVLEEEPDNSISSWFYYSLPFNVFVGKAMENTVHGKYTVCEGSSNVKISGGDEYNFIYSSSNITLGPDCHRNDIRRTNECHCKFSTYGANIQNSEYIYINDELSESYIHDSTSIYVNGPCRDIVLGYSVWNTSSGMPCNSIIFEGYNFSIYIGAYEGRGHTFSSYIIKKGASDMSLSKDDIIGSGWKYVDVVDGEKYVYTMEDAKIIRTSSVAVGSDWDDSSSPITGTGEYAISLTPTPASANDITLTTWKCSGFDGEVHPDDEDGLSDKVYGSISDDGTLVVDYIGSSASKTITVLATANVLSGSSKAVKNKFTASKAVLIKAAG